MKKTFALVLAIAMVMSLAAVSFAAADVEMSLTGPNKYSADAKKMTALGAKTPIEYGKAVYYMLDSGEGMITDYADVEKLKVKVKWEMGADLVESIAIVKKNVELGTKYGYFLEVKTVAKEVTSDADIVGTVTFNKKKSNDSTWTVKDCDVDINFIVGYPYNYNVTEVEEVEDEEITTYPYLVKGDIADLVWDEYYLLKFDYDDEVEFSFGSINGGNNEGTFTVDVSGQGKILFKYNTKANEAITAANPGAKMKFISFNNPKFNRTGEFMFEMEDGAYAYQIVDGKLATIPSCEYDDADEAFYFHTRTLGSYVFSDVELVDAVAAAPVVEAPAVENPTTGAAA